MKSEYDIQAEKFLSDTNTIFKVKEYGYGYYFPEDKEQRYIFKFTLKNSNGSYTAKFGQSISEGSNEPTAYSVLACLTKYDVGSFEDFCSEFGYDTDSRTAERTYKAVCKEFAGISKLFTTEQLEQLQEIN